ncbi:MULTISPECIES: 50S ribosomal protein L30 [Metallosphaera]|uniref:50S ribosomal protein L30 n=1 Tax=Metallosphaera TaxID=41980 RepID=UPI001F05732E|nr:50S ribosomal protein L30 [Metallosphaera sedula]MCH1771899.1 50S ribosomal protein L30 [Metallosphaera sedula]MCP6729228.1 50S ribosomal protein L30 [Metallosphaera sedula]
MSSILIVRIRGSASTPWDLQEVLEMLRLSKQYSAMVYPKQDDIVGMVRKVQSYVTWGELNMDGAKALMSRIETVKGALDQSFIEKELGLSTEDFIKKLVDGELKLNSIPSIKLPIRLHPPRKGFKGKINSFIGSGGELGYRGEKINELVRRMV